MKIGRYSATNHLLNFLVPSGRRESLIHMLSSLIIGYYCGAHPRLIRSGDSTYLKGGSSQVSSDTARVSYYGSFAVSLDVSYIDSNIKTARDKIL